MSDKVTAEERKYWTTRELADEAGVNPSRIRQLLGKGELQGHKAGRDWLIPDRIARRWLAERNRD